MPNNAHTRPVMAELRFFQICHNTKIKGVIMNAIKFDLIKRPAANEKAQRQDHLARVKSLLFNRQSMLRATKEVRARSRTNILKWLNIAGYMLTIKAARSPVCLLCRCLPIL